MHKLDELLSAVRSHYLSLPAGSRGRREMLAHLEGLTRWHAEPFDYEVPLEVSFPDTVQVVHAVCHPECGHETLMIDGEMQRCRRCGGTLLRIQSQEYRINSGDSVQLPAVSLTAAGSATPRDGAKV